MVIYLLLNQNLNVYFFDSQTESTTTNGLESDSDLLSSQLKFNIIQDWSEWKPGKINLLMIQNDTVSPGYCYLQILRHDIPLPLEANYQDNENTHIDRRGRILLKNTLVNYCSVILPVVRHGPAQTVHSGNVLDYDIVLALPNLSWPIQARQWLDQESERQWPTADMKNYSRGTGCFVVPVGNKNSANEEVEWRISTSLAERCCMFNLSITQIRCYILMKMIIKTFISTHCPDSISSFMCKTVLLHCVSNTITNSWKENNLLPCITYCLSTLYHCVLNEHCPHFIIPQNNLMHGCFSPYTKRFLLENISNIVKSNGNALLEIELDQLGIRIQNSFLGFVEIYPEHIPAQISGILLRNTAMTISEGFLFMQMTINCFGGKHLCFRRFLEVNSMYQGQWKIALAKQLCNTLGSVLASSRFYHQRSLTRESLMLMEFGFESDVASGKLKLASVFYCAGDLERTEMILKNIGECYDLSVVEPICNCYDFERLSGKETFDKLCYEENDECTLLNRITASCVRFIRSEINCCPHELQHEMFRSTQQDLSYRDLTDFWMDFAVVDSLPYLHFLQYKIYSHLRRNEDKERVICNLARCIDVEPNFGHIETALNLLGQRMEEENKVDAAFKCYITSLKIRESNNAAKFHICRLLCSLLNIRI
jgi:hypothetical protein